MTTRAWLRALALLALIGSVHAAELELAVARGPVSLLVYVAEAKSYFAAEGVAPHLRDCASGRACFEQLAQGQADLATAAELLVALDSFNKPSDLAIVATLSASSQQIKLVARRSAGIEAPAQLQGKRIGSVPGTSAQYFLDTWLLFHEVDPRQVQFVPLPAEQLAGALQRREVDAVAIWEPHAAKALAALAGDVAALPGPRVYTQRFNLVTSRRALARAERLVAERPAEAAAILKARLQIDTPLAEAALTEHEHGLRLDAALLATMDSQTRWALREGHVAAGQRPGNLLRSVEAAPLRHAVPGAVSLLGP